MATDLKAKYANILLRPRITEKATFLTEANVYAFEIASDATKKQVGEAIKVFYKVTPVKINIVNRG
jgi:large subunit ribosomal protein L23